MNHNIFLIGFMGCGKSLYQLQIIEDFISDILP